MGAWNPDWMNLFSRVIITSAFLITFTNFVQDGAVCDDEDAKRESVHHDHSEGGVHDLVHPRREEVESDALLVPAVFRVWFHMEYKHLQIIVNHDALNLIKVRLWRPIGQYWNCIGAQLGSRIEIQLLMFSFTGIDTIVYRIRRSLKLLPLLFSIKMD